MKKTKTTNNQQLTVANYKNWHFSYDSHCWDHKVISVKKTWQYYAVKADLAYIHVQKLSEPHCLL